jgi:hypothetical protein
MRVNHFLPIAAFSFTAVLNAQSAGGQLQWLHTAIDDHAATHHFEPPAQISQTKWEVAKIDGCTVELKQTSHRESPDTVYEKDGIFGLSEDKVVTWTFDLGDLRPDYITAGTATGEPHLKIFAAGDVFHLKTDVVSRNTNKDGSVASTRNWSTTGNARNLWMYFDSPDADNNMAVKKLAAGLRSAVSACVTPSKKVKATP